MYIENLPFYSALHYYYFVSSVMNIIIYYVLFFTSINFYPQIFTRNVFKYNTNIVQSICVAILHEYVYTFGLDVILTDFIYNNIVDYSFMTYHTIISIMI